MRTIRCLAISLILTLLSAMLPLTSAMAYNMPYYIDVDLSNCIVTVYSSEDDSIVRQMICSGGTAWTPSPTGTFFMTEKYKPMERTEWYTFEDGYGKYGSRIWDNYLFHSFLFYEKDMDTVKHETYAGLGTPASHGCIRLHIEDAKWIAENCMPGTRVKLFYTSERFDYIKEIIYVETYTIDNGISYDRYIGRAENEGELGYESQGEEVTALQMRLIELGLYDGEADGFYGPQMVRTIRSLQQLLGLEITGIADAELIALINSDECPTSILCTLSEGMSGNTVVSLQKILTALGLYEGEINGEFDEATKEAVIAYQLMAGYEPDGIATSELQQEMLLTAQELSTDYGEFGAQLVYDEQIRTVAAVTVDQRLNVRAADGTVIDSVENGESVEVLSIDGDWTYISYRSGRKGYVSTDYLAISEETILIPRYTAAPDAVSALPALEIGGYAALKTVSYGTISINSRLNFRTEPNSEAELSFILSPGTECEIISTNDDGWAYVRYGDRYGYAMTKYFNIKHTTELTGEYVIPQN